MNYSHIDAGLAVGAADLFSAQYEVICAKNATHVPDAFEQSQLAEDLLAWALNGASVVAHEDGVIHGYLVGRFINWYHSESAFYSPEWAHNISIDRSGRLITDMYAWLTRSGQLDNSSLHAIGVFASDKSTKHALNNLEFGTHQIEGVFRSFSVGESRISPADVTIRSGIPADLPRIIELDKQLWTHLANPPTSLDVSLSEYPENRSKYQIPRDDSYISVAEIDGRMVGFISCRMDIQESKTLRSSAVPHVNGAFVHEEYRDRNVAQLLLQDIFRWSVERSAPHVTVDFESNNVEGAGFWLSRDFKPLVYGMVRRPPPIRTDSQADA
jgi:GNAT superfamily N-acetyltransferase